MALVPCEAEAQKVLLEYKYTSGQQFVLKGSSTVTVSETWKGLANPAGSGQPRNQKSSFVAIQHVDEVDGDGVATLSTKIESLRVDSEDLDRHVVTTIDKTGLKVVVDGVTVTDTAKLGDGQPGDGQQLIEHLVKDTTTVKMRKNGAVASLAGGPAAAVAGLAAQGGQSPVMSSISFPERPVSAGETWETSQDMAAMLGTPAGVGDFKSKCTLEKIEETGAGQIARIKQNIRIRMAGWTPRDQGAQQDESMRIDDLQVDAVIRVSFNIDAGIIVESKIDLTEHREMSIDVNAAGPDAGIPSRNRIRFVTDTHMVGTVTVTPST